MWANKKKNVVDFFVLVRQSRFYPTKECIESASKKVAAAICGTFCLKWRGGNLNELSLMRRISSPPPPPPSSWHIFRKKTPILPEFKTQKEKHSGIKKTPNMWETALRFKARHAYLPAHLPPSQPPTVACKIEAQLEYIQAAYTLLHVLSPIGMLCRCLSNKISASELSRKFIKIALLAGFLPTPPPPAQKKPGLIASLSHNKRAFPPLSCSSSFSSSSSSVHF